RPGNKPGGSADSGTGPGIHAVGAAGRIHSRLSHLFAVPADRPGRRGYSDGSRHDDCAASDHLSAAEGDVVRTDGRLVAASASACRSLRLRKWCLMPPVQQITPEVLQWITAQARAGHTPEAVLEAMRARGWHNATAATAIEKARQGGLTGKLPP